MILSLTTLTARYDAYILRFANFLWTTTTTTTTTIQPTEPIALPLAHARRVKKANNMAAKEEQET